MKQVPAEEDRTIIMLDGQQVVYYAPGPRRDDGVVDGFKMWVNHYPIRDEEILAYFKKSQIDSGQRLFPFVHKLARKVGRELVNGPLDPGRLPEYRHTKVSKERWAILVGMMLAEENREHTALGKNMKVFALYKVLVEGCCPVTAAVDTKHMTAKKIEAFCRKKGIWIERGRQSQTDDPLLEC